MVTAGTTAKTDGKTAAQFGLAYGAGQACISANIAAFSHNKTSDTYKTFSTLDLAFAGLKQLTGTELGAAIGIGKMHNFVTERDGRRTIDTNYAGVIAANSGKATDIGKGLGSI